MRRVERVYRFRVLKVFSQPLWVRKEFEHWNQTHLCEGTMTRAQVLARAKADVSNP